MDTEYISEDAKMAVKRGIYWLDENHPGWAQRIDLGTLEMSECQDCVIGQAIGDYGENIVKASGVEYPASARWSIEHGFESPVVFAMNDGLEVNYGYRELDILWSEEVQKRLG